VARRTGEDNVGVLFDAAHYHCTPTKFDQIDAENTPLVRHVHVDDMQDKPGELSHCNSDRVLPGEGCLDLPALQAPYPDLSAPLVADIQVHESPLRRSLTLRQDPMNDKTPHDPADLGLSSPLVPPLYQSSVYTLPDLDTLDRIMDEGAPGFFYARDGHPNARFLGARLAEVENARWGVVCASGMAVALFLATLHQRDHRHRATAWLDVPARYRNSPTSDQDRVADANEPAQVKVALLRADETAAVETMSEPAVRVVDLPALAEIAREHNRLSS
jgi:hypothetical protein